MPKPKKPAVSLTDEDIITAVRLAAVKCELCSRPKMSDMPCPYCQDPERPQET